MQFRVEESALDAGAQQLTTLAREVTAARSYLADHVDLDGLGDSGIFVTSIGVLDSIRGAVQGSLRHLEELTSETAQELRATARTYRSSDDAAERDMEQTFDHGTAAAHPGWRGPGGPVR